MLLFFNNWLRDLDFPNISHYGGRMRCRSPTLARPAVFKTELGADQDILPYDYYTKSQKLIVKNQDRIVNPIFLMAGPIRFELILVVLETTVLPLTLQTYMVAMEGLEPSCLSTFDFKSSPYTNSGTPPN